MSVRDAISDMFSPALYTLLILAGAVVVYAAVMIWLRPWRPANKDESAPLWKFLVLGFGFRLRRHQGLAAGSWAVLIVGVVAAALYYRIATYRLLTDPDGPMSVLAPMALLSDDTNILIPLEPTDPERSCSVQQLAGAGDLSRCRLDEAAGQVVLQIDGFDIACEATCTGGGRMDMAWEYSRGPAPGDAVPADDADS